MNVPDSQDLLCPITFQEYTSENPPVTIPCGHTLSLEAFQKSLNSRNNCPICRSSLPEGYNPKKNFLLVKLLESLKGNLPLTCSIHKQENAIAICTNDKTYLCVKCLRNDKCPEENIIPKEKFKTYLLGEATKMNEKESEILQGLFSDLKIDEEVFSLVNPLLVDITKWELSKQYHAKNLKEKQGLTQQIMNYGQIKNEDDDGKIKVLSNIEARYKNLNSLKTQEEVSKRNLEANKIVKRKLISLLSEEPFKIAVDNSLKEMEKLNKNFCEELELYFEEGFNNREKFFERLGELENLDSLSMHNLGAFENFGAQDLQKLTPICQKIHHLHIDFAGMQKSQNEASGLQLLFNQYMTLKTVHFSFKESKFASEQDLMLLYDFLTISHSISSLTLNFEKCEEATNSVIQRLIPLVPLHKEFSLNLLHCPHLTQETIQKLTKCFWQDPGHNANYFKNLTLKLGHSPYFSSSWLQSFSFYLQQMQIRRLTLHFEGCPEIEYKGVNHLISAISKIEDLKELNLSFADCKNLTGVRVFKNLSHCVKKLENLKVFILCIKQCPRFHFNGLEKLRKEIKNVPVIELDCPVTEELKKKLKNIRVVEQNSPAFEKNDGIFQFDDDEEF